MQPSACQRDATWKSPRTAQAHLGTLCGHAPENVPAHGSALALSIGGWAALCGAVRTFGRLDCGVASAVALLAAERRQEGCALLWPLVAAMVECAAALPTCTEPGHSGRKAHFALTLAVFTGGLWRQRSIVSSVATNPEDMPPRMLLDAHGEVFPNDVPDLLH